MSDEEHDYLSDKFLAQLERPSSGSLKTYHDRRRDAKRISEQKNIANRVRSHKEIEEESRREGLSKSLFERAREEEERSRKRRKLGGSDEDDGNGREPEPEQPKNKALAMMLKMGFKEGQSLGKSREPPSAEPGESSVPSPPERGEKTGHLVEPIPLAIWAGRQGLGSGRRIFAAARASQPPKLLPNGLASVTQSEVKSQADYRSRTRFEYEQKRDVGRLRKARKTLTELDAKRGVTIPETIPEAMQARLDQELGSGGPSVISDVSEAAQLRAQMRLDPLQPLTLDADYGGDVCDDQEPGPNSEPTKLASGKAPEHDFDVDTVQDTKDWLLLSVQDRLRFTLQHLRQEYFYCFWCGAEYVDQEELDELCPGETEETHD